MLLIRDDNRVGMGWATPTPFPSQLYIFFLIPIPNPGRGELVSLIPIYKRADNLIPVPNVFPGIMKHGSLEFQ